MGSREKIGVKSFISFWALRSKCVRSSARWVACLCIFGIFIPAAFLLMCLCLGCNDVERHRVLTFFFEGVPPVDHEFWPVQVATSKRIKDYRESGGGVTTSFRSGQERGSDHPARDCNKCHRSSGRSGRRLVEPPPGLCYSCHEDHKAKGEYLHGPAIAGECLFCHESHRSRYVHLQKAPVPDLCYRCHRREDMPTIVDHEDKLETICTDCHDPHASSMKKLLKPGWDAVGDPNSIDSVEIPQEDPNSVM